MTGREVCISNIMCQRMAIPGEPVESDEQEGGLRYGTVATKSQRRVESCLVRNPRPKLVESSGCLSIITEGEGDTTTLWARDEGETNSLDTSTKLSEMAWGST